MQSGHTTDYAQNHRRFKHARQHIAIAFPTRDRAILPRLRGIGVYARFDRTPVIAGRNQNRINAVEHALVIGRGPVRILLGKERSLLNFFCEFGIDIVDLDRRARHLGINKIRKNAHGDSVAGELFDGLF